MQRHVGVNNLPRVVTRQRGGRESNSHPWSYQSDALTTMTTDRAAPFPKYIRSINLFGAEWLDFIDSRFNKSAII